MLPAAKYNIVIFQPGVKSQSVPVVACEPPRLRKIPDSPNVKVLGMAGTPTAKKTKGHGGVP